MSYDFLKKNQPQDKLLPFSCQPNCFFPPFTFETSFLVARLQGRGSQAGSAAGRDPMKDHLPSAEEGGKRRFIWLPRARFRPYR
jgi:hypothetical protein